MVTGTTEAVRGGKTLQQAETSFILSTFFANRRGGGRRLLCAVPFRGLSASVDLTTVIFSALALGWLILPIFAFGLDGTL